MLLRIDRPGLDGHKFSLQDMDSAADKQRDKTLRGLLVPMNQRERAWMPQMFPIKEEEENGRF